MNELFQQVQRLQEQVLRAQGALEALKARRRQLTEDLLAQQERKHLLEQEIQAVRLLSSVVKSKIAKDFSKLVTEGIRFIFEKDLEFVVHLDSEKAIPQASFKVIYEGQERHPLDDMGGGIVDVISFCLRLVMLELLHLEGPLFLDEPFKHLSSYYRERAALFLREYAETSGRQILLVTHSPEMEQAAHKVFVVTQEGSSSKVTPKEVSSAIEGS